jgi:ribose transport system permease protein
LLSAVACVVLGGTSLFGGEGGVGKTLIGVLTFTVLNVGLIQVNWINDLARQLLTGLVLLVALVVNGLLAKRRS